MGLSNERHPAVTGARSQDTTLTAANHRRIWNRPGLLGLLAISIVLRLLWLDYSGRELMVDEGYYIPAAHNILRLEPFPSDPYLYAHDGIDPNLEHPIGAKRLMAASISMFGDNAFGWRLPSVVCGTLAILFVYLLACRLTNRHDIALSAAALTALDPMMLVHSRVAMLDIFVVTFLLAGLYAYVEGRPIIAGLMIAAATCSKLTGLAGLVVIAIFEAGRLWIDQGGGRWSIARLRPLTLAFGSALVCVPSILFALNLGHSVFPNPLDNLFCVYTHQAATYSFQSPGPVPQSAPWEWLLNRQEITYFKHGVLHLRGLYNPFLVFAFVPVLVGTTYDFFRKRSELSLLVLAIIGGCYLPLVAASMQAPRETYLYYFLPTLPALAMGTSAFIHRTWVPRFARVTYLVAALAAFVWLFPFRGLP